MEEDAESTVRSKTKSERCSFSFFSFIYEAQRRIQTFRFVLFVFFFARGIFVPSWKKEVSTFRFLYGIEKSWQIRGLWENKMRSGGIERRASGQILFPFSSSFSSAFFFFCCWSYLPSLFLFFFKNWTAPINIGSSVFDRLQESSIGVLFTIPKQHRSVPIYYLFHSDIRPPASI